MMRHSGVQAVNEEAQWNGFRTLIPASNTIVIKSYEGADNGFKSVLADEIMEHDGEAAIEGDDLVVEF